MKRKFRTNYGPFVLEGFGMKAKVPNNLTTGQIDVGKNANTIMRMIRILSTVVVIEKLGKFAISIYRIIKDSNSKHEGPLQPESKKSETEAIEVQTPIAVPMAEQLKKCREIAIEREFLGHTFLLKGTRNILYGARKSLKSTLATSLAKSVATGKDYGLSLNLQGHNHTGAILVDIYDAEHTAEDIVERYEGEDIKNLTFITQFAFSSFEDYVSAIRKRAFEVRQDMLVICDNSTKIFGELTAKECNAFDTQLKDLQKEAKAEGFTITLLTIMHSGKDSNRGPIGTSNFENFSENVFEIEKMSSRFSKLTFKACRHYADGKLYVLERASNKFAMTFNPAETERLCNNATDYADGGWDGESSIDANLTGPQQMTPEQIKELIDFYQASQAHGYGTCFKKFGRKFGFKSESTMTRFIKRHI